MLLLVFGVFPFYLSFGHCRFGAIVAAYALFDQLLPFCTDREEMVSSLWPTPKGAGEVPAKVAGLR